VKCSLLHHNSWRILKFLYQMSASNCWVNFILTRSCMLEIHWIFFRILIFIKEVLCHDRWFPLEWSKRSILNLIRNMIFCARKHLIPISREINWARHYITSISLFGLHWLRIIIFALIAILFLDLFLFIFPIWI
jgi:hypothetical protein